MSYSLNKLGANNFEHLVQALCKKIIGEGVSIYGAGPDGQREATFNGKAPYPSDKECWNGYWVIQAKFKEPNTRKADYLWLKDCFEEEMAKFKIKKEEGKEIPDNYLFFTNIVLTPVAEKGIKDKIELEAKKYNSLIPNIHIIGADDINRFLEGNRDIASAYSSYILSGDILAYLYESVQEKNIDRQNSFYRYLYQAFCNDFCSRMEQAGQLSEEKVSIDKVYIDLKFKDEYTGIEEKFIEYAINIGNQGFRYSLSEPNKNNHNEVNWSGLLNKYVLKGTAGQGKSTVCQFLAQIYRASFIKNFSNLCDQKIIDFLNRIQNDRIPLPKCYRIPVRIELRLYSSWIANRKKENKQYDLVTYISTLIGDISSSKFDNDSLRLYFKKFAWVFIFDGLDEVPESSNRKDVMSEIESFINVELRQADTDAVFFATTRPEGYVGEFNNINFCHLELLPLNKEECFLYLNKLLVSIEDSSTKRKDYLKILEQGWDNKQIAFMMQTPLQVTIITILVRSGGEPPRDKFSLFKEYFEIIIKREKQKCMGTILNENQDLIESIYYLLGYDLQKRSVHSESGDALISLNDMKSLIKKKLIQDGIPENEDLHNQLLKDVYAMIVNRINFASEIREGYIGFSIRTMQEFLASVYIVRNNDDLKLGNLLKALAKSSYWKNTFIFVVECIVKEKTYYLDILIDTILGELNGDDLSIDNINMVASVNYGSQVAFDLLVNNVFKNKPRYENKLCKYIPKYCELEYFNDISKIDGMSDNVKKELSKYLISKNNLTELDCMMLSALLQYYSEDVLLKKHCENNAVLISKTYFKHNRYYFPPQMYNLVLTALQSKEILSLDLVQISDFINISSEKHSKEVKETLFKITIKAILNFKWKSDDSVDLINYYFGGDFSSLITLRKWINNDRIKISKDIFVTLKMPYNNNNNNNERFNEIVKLCEKYNCKSMALVLNTIISKNFEDYELFSDKVIKLVDEIKILNIEQLIRENGLLYFLWQKMIVEQKYSESKNILEMIKKKLDNFVLVEDISQLLKEIEEEPMLYGLHVMNTNSVFLDFFKTTKQIYTIDEIVKFPLICNILAFLYCCQYNHSKKSDNLEIDLQILNEMFKICEKTDENSPWQMYIWEISFLKLKVQDIFEHKDVLFNAKKGLKQNKLFVDFNETQQINILNKAILYYSINNNSTIIEFILEFILTVNTFDVIGKINYEQIMQCEDQRLLILKEMSHFTNESDFNVDFFEKLEDEKVFNYLYSLILNVNMPSHFAPLYVYYLKKYKHKGERDDIEYIERRIVEYINTFQINTDILDF